MYDQIKKSGPQDAETGEGNRGELVDGLRYTLAALINTYGTKAVLCAAAEAFDGEVEQEVSLKLASLAVKYPGEVNPVH